MGTIVVILAFLLAASANPIDPSSNDASGESPGTNVHDSPHSSTDEVSSDVAEASGEHMRQPEEEHGPSSADSSVSSGDDSHKKDDEPTLPGDTASVSAGNDANNIPEDVVSSSVSTVSPVSTEHGDKTNGNEHTDASLSDTISTSSTNGPINVDTDTTNVTEPPDADPYDCKTRDPLKHIYEECTFSCGGDMVEVAPENSSCVLNYTGNFTEKSEPIGLEENATGVCREGKCIPKPNNVMETTPQSSTATTTTTTTTTPTIPETTPEPSMADTVANTETRDPGSPTTHNDTDVGIEIPSQSHPSQLGDDPVAME